MLLDELRLQQKVDPVGVHPPRLAQVLSVQVQLVLLVLLVRCQWAPHPLWSLQDQLLRPVPMPRVWLLLVFLWNLPWPRGPVPRILTPLWCWALRPPACEEQLLPVYLCPPPPRLLHPQ